MQSLLVSALLLLACTQKLPPLWPVLLQSVAGVCCFEGLYSMPGATAAHSILDTCRGGQGGADANNGMHPDPSILGDESSACSMHAQAIT
jgi:hypothetical protein